MRHAREATARAAKQSPTSTAAGRTLADIVAEAVGRSASSLLRISFPICCICTRPLRVREGSEWEWSGIITIRFLLAGSRPGVPAWGRGRSGDEWELGGWTVRERERCDGQESSPRWKELDERALLFVRARPLREGIGYDIL